MNKNQTDALLVVLHWTVAAAAVVSLLTGFRIAADSGGAVVTRWLAPITLDGRVHVFHTWSSVAILTVAIAYYVYLHHGRLFGRVKLARISAGKSNPRLAWKRRNTILYQILFVLILLLAITGVILYFDFPLPFGLGVGAVVTIHLWLAWGLVATTILHVLAQYQFGATAGKGAAQRLRHGFDWLLKMLRPSFRSGRSSGTLRTHPITVAVTVGAAALAGGGIVLADRQAHRGLAVASVTPDQAPTLDGRGDDPAWGLRPATEILTREGVNLPAGQSLVQVQAAEEGEHMYLKFRWQDPTRSFKHLPLQKTDAGWRLLHQAYDIEDEDFYYEDKFAVLLSTSAEIGGGVTHLGPKPLADKPGSLSGRGLHYTTDGSIADMWQWKAVRSEPLGKLDDDSFGPPAEPKPEEIARTLRYKGGYVTDPGKVSVKNNFAHEAPGGYEGPITPLRLPTDLLALQTRLGPIDTDTDVSDQAPLLMWDTESAEFTPELDATIPVGTVIPGVIVVGTGGYEGDRGDVLTGAHWEDGWWTLEVKRKLDTGSEKDVAFTPGATVYLWVSVFDHSQTRHSRHMRPVAITMPAAQRGV